MLNEPIVCMYACPSVDFNPQPFQFEYLPLAKQKIMTIQEYKKKFIELFEQMEQEHGPCSSVVIDHLDQFGINSSGKLSDINCSIEY